MTKQEVIKRIREKSGVEGLVIRKVLEAYATVVKEALLEGVNVNFRNFGTFYLKHRAAKTARNITAGTTMIIPAHDIVAFKPANEFAEEITQRTEEKA